MKRTLWTASSAKLACWSLELREHPLQLWLPLFSSRPLWFHFAAKQETQFSQVVLLHLGSHASHVWNTSWRLGNVNRNVWSRELSELFPFDSARFRLWTWRILTFNDGVQVKTLLPENAKTIWRTQTTNEHEKLEGARVQTLLSCLWRVRR